MKERHKPEKKINQFTLCTDDMTGRIRIPEDELTAGLIEANKMDLRCLVHVVSYNAMDIALRSFEKALSHNPRKDHRHRIEHSGNSNCSIQHIKEMKKLGIIASLNPGFIYFFGEKEFVDRARDENDIFPLRSLEDHGVTTIMNTDFCAIPPDPFKAIYFAVTRKTKGGATVVPQQSIPVETAIRQYTINAAYAGFEESSKGTLEIGKVADMIVVSEDPTVGDASRIKDIHVIKTIINGEVVHNIE